MYQRQPCLLIAICSYCARMAALFWIGYWLTLCLFYIIFFNKNISFVSAVKYLLCNEILCRVDLTIIIIIMNNFFMFLITSIIHFLYLLPIFKTLAPNSPSLSFSHIDAFSFLFLTLFSIRIWRLFLTILGNISPNIGQLDFSCYCHYM